MRASFTFPILNKACSIFCVHHDAPKGTAKHGGTVIRSTMMTTLSDGPG